MKKSALFMLLGFFTSVLTFSSEAKEVRPTFNPQGKEVFILGKLKGADYDSYYKGVCTSLPDAPRYSFRTECEDDGLYYHGNVGKRFIFTGVTSISPIKDIAKEILLEDGQTVYLIYYESGSGPSYVKPADKEVLKEIDNFQPGPIYPGAKTMITSINRGEELTYSLFHQFGPRMNKAQLSFLRTIAARYPETGPRIADLLASFVFEYDDFDKRVIVYGSSSQGIHNFWSLRLLITNEGDVHPLVAVNYRGDDWLFISQYSVSADEFRWSSNRVNFKRRHENGTVYEWNITDADDFSLSLAKKISKSENAVIRFRGQNSNFDEELSRSQKLELSSLLELYELLIARPNGAKEK
ncbi:hypothetical protein JAO78_006630 [Alishewanella sp. 16-MA]|uniref:Uncharacterized protein n=1 Tax=Alishewanella maricola TaxID=2795740 RepID=A0ABS8C2C2_9ALTE|nr:hypothetical protein [Alishewanella maricola]MCB5226487.1 hypothetical protein [Alishewanella maricola]